MYRSTINPRHCFIPIAHVTQLPVGDHYFIHFFGDVHNSFIALPCRKYAVVHIHVFPMFFDKGPMDW